MDELTPEQIRDDLLPIFIVLLVGLVVLRLARAPIRHLLQRIFERQVQPITGERLSAVDVKKRPIANALNGIAVNVGVITALVRLGVARGEFRESAVTAIPQVLLAPAVMTAVWLMTFQRIQPMDLAEMRAAHVELITRALDPHRA